MSLVAMIDRSIMRRILGSKPIGSFQLPHASLVSFLPRKLWGGWAETEAVVGSRAVQWGVGPVLERLFRWRSGMVNPFRIERATMSTPDS